MILTEEFPQAAPIPPEGGYRQFDVGPQEGYAGPISGSKSQPQMTPIPQEDQVSEQSQYQSAPLGIAGAGASIGFGSY